MTPIKHGRYEYRPATLIHLRQRLSLKQKNMAELLGVPANTLSRWENGATTPDAESLAAIYSLAKERGVTAEFFQPRKSGRKAKKQETRVLTMWDLNGMAFQIHQLDKLDDWITDLLRTRFGTPTIERYKVFANPSQSAETEKLSERHWDVWEYAEDVENELISHAKSDCGQAPEETAFVLIGKNDTYVELLKELLEWGVDVYLIESNLDYEIGLINKIPSVHRIRLPFGLSPSNVVRIQEPWDGLFSPLRDLSSGL